MTESTGDQGENVWVRLRRRKVVQWGVAYAVGVWGFLQGLSYLIATFHWPESLQQIATLALLAGLPIVLVIAWYHGDQGSQKITAAESTIIALLCLLGGALLWQYDYGIDARPPSRERSAGGAAVPAVNDAPPNSIAVLPFVNMSGDPANEYFSDGVSEEILNVLARMPGLRVAARTSSFSFKDKSAEIPEIARELKVRMVLEGSVRKQGDTVRISAQLTDARSGFNVWSETYDRRLTDIFAIQEEIASAIGSRMKIRSDTLKTAFATRNPTTSPEAHDHYLRGLQLWQRRRETQLWQAIDEFGRAIKIDPRYAQAYGGLALAYAVVPDYSLKMSYEQAVIRATDAAHVALALDPGLPEAYAALGAVAMVQHRRPVARMLLERAIALRPSFATACHWIGAVVATGGDPTAGLAWLDRAAELDPRSLAVASNRTYVLSAIGRYDEAPAACERALEIAPDFTPCLVNLGLGSVMRGDPEAARPYFLKAAEVANPSAVPLVNQLIDALEGRGDKRAMALRLSQYLPRSFSEPGSGTVFAADDTLPLLMALGAPDLALGYLDRHGNEPYSKLDWALIPLVLDPIRCDVRFQAAEKSLNVTDLRATKLCGQTRAESSRNRQPQPHSATTTRAVHGVPQSRGIGRPNPDFSSRGGRLHMSSQVRLRPEADMLLQSVFTSRRTGLCTDPWLTA